MRPFNLVTKLTLLAVLPATLIAGTLGGYLVWRSYQSLREQAQAAQLALAQSLASRADQGISQSFLALQFLAKSPAVVQLNKEVAESQLSLVAEADDLLDAALLVLPSGEVLAQSHPGLDPKLLPPASLYAENLARVKELKESVITDIYPVRRNGRDEPAQAVSTPIFRAGRLVGTMVGVMHLPSHLQETLLSGVFGKESFAYLVSEEGVTLAHTDPSKVLKDFSGNPAVTAALRDPEGVVRYQRADGVRMLAAFARVESATWSVVLSQPLEDAYEPASRALRWLILYLAGCLLLLAALAVMVAQRMSGPLASLTERVSRQDWKGLAATEGKATGDEVVLLAQALSGMARDLEEQRRAREVAHRRALVAERRLAEKERLASIGQLAAGLAHELNNPLAVISGAAEVALEAPRSELPKWMGSIGKEARRCKRLIADLLDFARPLKLKLARTDLVALAREAWEQGRLSLAAADPGCLLEIKGTQAIVHVDPERLKQVFLNLFGNAREVGCSRVKVAFSHPKSGWVRVEVSDDGPGLAADPEKYFRPFFTQRPGGTGLGLPIARMVVQAHGGSLWGLRSSRSKSRGARFIFEVPA